MFKLIRIIFSVLEIPNLSPHAKHIRLPDAEIAFMVSQDAEINNATGLKHTSKWSN
jgi:hypothetical protein